MVVADEWRDIQRDQFATAKEKCDKSSKNHIILASIRAMGRLTINA